MRKPTFLNDKKTIGMLAPSFGLFEEPYITRYKKAKEFFVNQGYKIVESESLYCENYLGEAKGEKRAKEFMEMYLDDNIDILFSVAGGELMIEILSYIDFVKIKEAKPKYFMGYSDNTNLTFLLTTICDVESIYGINATSYGRGKEKFIFDHFSLITGKKKTFLSYPKYEDEDVEEYSFTRDVYYIGECDVKGMLIGGCLEVLQSLCGTRYDNMKEFNKKYDNLIWYIEPYALEPLRVLAILWQLKNASWFDKAIAFVFGRSYFDDEKFSYIDSIKRALVDLNVPIIINADIGHIPPILPIVNGGMARISVKEGKGVIEYD